jgi:predicted nucleic acid-binding protein
MTSPALMLDAAALSELASSRDSAPSPLLYGLLEATWQRQRDVLVPAVVCAEVCRGKARTTQVEALLARHRPGTRQSSPILVIETDFSLARLVGSVLNASKAGSKDIVDAHLVALCIDRGGGLIVTSDPDDLRRLSGPFLGTRIVVRSLNL